MNIWKKIFRRNSDQASNSKLNSGLALKLSQITTAERSILNGIHPELCVTAIEEREGKRTPNPDLGLSGALIILRKLDLAEIWIVEASNQYGIMGDGSPNDDSAAECYRKAFEINPYNDLAMMSYGCVLAAMGRLAEGTKWVRKATEINPKNERAKRNLAKMEADLR